MTLTTCAHMQALVSHISCLLRNADRRINQRTQQSRAWDGSGQACVRKFGISGAVSARLCVACMHVQCAKFWAAIPVRHDRAAEIWLIPRVDTIVPPQTEFESASSGKIVMEQTIIGTYVINDEKQGNCADYNMQKMYSRYHILGNAHVCCNLAT
jgi:hypothetical protein